MFLDGRDSDSDGPPDNLAFSSSKEKSLQKFRETLSQIGSQKDKLKQRRKQRNERFAEQKVIIFN